MLQSITEYNRVLRNIREYYRVFLAHLLGPIFGLVFGNLGTPRAFGHFGYFWATSIQRVHKSAQNAQKCPKVLRVAKPKKNTLRNFLGTLYRLPKNFFSKLKIKKLDVLNFFLANRLCACS